MSKLFKDALLWIVFVLGVALFSASLGQSPSPAELGFQSIPPGPVRVRNPNVIESAEGGRIYCILQQGPVWIGVPKGFLSEGSAEIHCNITGSLSQQMGVSDAWDDHGYLIGVYTDKQIVKPLTLVFQMDTARTKNICSTCFIARYYNVGNRSWQDLLTTYDTSKGYISIEISGKLPASGYPAYQDRSLIALFLRSGGAPTSTPTIGSTHTPAIKTTETPVRAFSPTSKPKPIPPPTPAPTPVVTPQPTLLSTSIPDKTTTPVTSSTPVGDGVFVIIILLLAAIILLLIFIVVFLFSQQRKS